MPVKVDVVLTGTDNIHLKINCTIFLKSFVKELILKVASNETLKNKTLPINCPIDKMQSINNLSPGTVYEVSIIYSFKSFEIECQLQPACTKGGICMFTHMHTLILILSLTCSWEGWNACWHHRSILCFHNNNLYYCNKDSMWQY